MGSGSGSGGGPGGGGGVGYDGGQYLPALGWDGTGGAIAVLLRGMPSGILRAVRAIKSLVARYSTEEGSGDGVSEPCAPFSRPAPCPSPAHPSHAPPLVRALRSLLTPHAPPLALPGLVLSQLGHLVLSDAPNRQSQPPHSSQFSTNSLPQRPNTTHQKNTT